MNPNAYPIQNSVLNSQNHLSLYFHIPFCTKKCDYCHFYVIPDKDPFKKQLMEGLRREWDIRLPDLKQKRIASIYFGGGTPALMGAEAIGEIIQWVRASFDVENIEITLEANPENINRQLITDYAKAGINRISIGLQTLNDPLLKTLGRLHTSVKSIQAVNETASAGIPNISIDLMYDLPGQTLQHWQDTLGKARDLPITHLSLYNLTIEPHTVFFKYRNKLQKQLPNEQDSLRMYEMAIDMLGERQLMQYEISAFAKDNMYSRHNTGYWTGRQFLGFGPSAFSYWQGKRFRNIANLSKYCKALESGQLPIDFDEELPPDARRRELLVIQLRLMEGVDLNNFQTRHGRLDKLTLETLQHLHQQGLLSVEGHAVALTKKGILFYDTVASELI